MTDEQILEAEKTIGAIKKELNFIADTTDADKLAAVVMETWPRISDSARQLGKLVSPGRLVENVLSIYVDVSPMASIAQMDQRRSKGLSALMIKEKLPDAVRNRVPRALSALDKIAQALREKAEE